MDDLLIKTNTVRDGVPPASGGQDGLTGLAGLAVSFQDLLHKAGTHIENSLFAIVDRAGIGAKTERSDAANPADDYRRQPDDGKDRVDPRARADDNRSDQGQSRARPVDRQDDSGRDHGDARGDDAGADRGADNGDGRADNTSGDRADNAADNASRDDAAAKKNDRADDQDSQAGDDAGKAAPASKKSDGKAKTAGKQADGGNGKTVVADQAGVAQQLLNPLLAGLLVAGDAKAADGDPAKPVENISATGSDNMSRTALDNITKLTPVATGNDGASSQNPKSHAQAIANAASQAKAVAAEPSAVKVETPLESAPTSVETQAASLARAIGDANKATGDANKVQINVNVTDEAQSLTSRPTASLSSGSVLAGDNANPSSGQGANTHVQAVSQNPAVQAQVQQSQGGPAPAQGAQNSQAPNAVQANTDAKGLVQATAASGNSGGTAHSGGGEAGMQANTGSATPGQQTQQAQQQAQAGQAQNADKSQRPGRSLVEQVSVKITKAINAGNDKITIQLRPANMGRVEVKMELTHDHRLTAVVTADNKDTLNALQRDARELQRALADAGLHTGNGDLNFNLRGQTGQGTDGDGKSAGTPFQDENAADATDAVAENSLFAHRDGIYVNGRIDVRA